MAKKKLKRGGVERLSQREGARMASKKRTRKRVRAAASKKQAQALAKKQAEALAKKKTRAVAKKRTRAVAKKRARAVSKKRTRAVAKKRTRAVAKKRTRAVAKKRARAVSKKRTRAVARTKAKLQKIVKAEQKARGLPKRSKEKQAIKKAKRELEKTRAAEGIAASEAATGEGTSGEDFFARMKRRFRQILNKAKAAGQLPEPTKVSRKISTQRRKGDRRRLRINRIISERSVEDILYRIQQAITRMSGNYRWWNGTITISTLGEGFIGSGATVLDLDDPDAVFFGAQGWESAGHYNDRQSMIIGFEKCLHEQVDKASTIVYLHYVDIMNSTDYPRK
jgi:hypothetical protein